VALHWAEENPREARKAGYTTGDEGLLACTLGANLLVEETLRSLQAANRCEVRDKGDGRVVRLIDQEELSRLEVYAAPQAALKDLFLSLLEDGDWHPYNGKRGLFARLENLLKRDFSHVEEELRAIFIDFTLAGLVEEGTCQQEGSLLNPRYRLTPDR
jgi:hypothetical protein